MRCRQETTRRCPDAGRDLVTGAAEPRADLADALRAVVVEVESHVDAAGWDAPPHLFALVPTRELAAAEPELAVELGIANGNAAVFTPVEQELDDRTEPLEELLGRIAWPDPVQGVVVAVERVVLPPEAEAGVPEDPIAAAGYAAAHEAREEVRITVGALRSGESHCVVRLRSHDTDEALVQGADVVPALVAAVRETLEPEPHRFDGGAHTPRGDR
jgi:hypothetical protein